MVGFSPFSLHLLAMVAASSANMLSHSPSLPVTMMSPGCRGRSKRCSRGRHQQPQHSTTEDRHKAAVKNSYQDAQGRWHGRAEDTGGPRRLQFTNTSCSRRSSACHSFPRMHQVPAAATTQLPLLPRNTCCWHQLRDHHHHPHHRPRPPRTIAAWGWSLMESAEPSWKGKLKLCCCCGHWNVAWPSRTNTNPLSPRLEADSVVPFTTRTHAVEEPAAAAAGGAVAGEGSRRGQQQSCDCPWRHCLIAAMPLQELAASTMLCCCSSLNLLLATPTHEATANKSNRSWSW